MNVSTASRMLKQDIYPRLSEPIVNPLVWSFAISGGVTHPLILSYADIQSFPQSDVTCAILAAGNPFDASQIEAAVWRGIPMRLLLDQVEANANVQVAVVHTANGYSTSIELAHLSQGILALEQDGARLLPQQGFPARLIVPGLYSDKQPRWVTRIEFVDQPTGFWESRGKRYDGIAPTIAAITRPHHHATSNSTVSLEGFAYSVEYPVTNIEVSIDDADWMPVSFTAAPAAQLVRWQVDWTPPAAGDYLIRVRASDASGFIQREISQHGSVFPSQTSALQRIVVHIRE